MGVFREAPLLVIGESELEGCNDHSSETFLHREDILEGAVVVLGPQMVVPARINELSADSQLSSCPPHASLENVANAKLTGDGLHVFLRVLEHHRRRA